MFAHRHATFLIIATLCALSAGCSVAATTKAASPQTCEGKPVERERISPENRAITAYHEAAHAIVGTAVGLPWAVGKLDVFSKTYEHMWGVTTWTKNVVGDGDVRRYRALALVHYAGHAVEEILYSKPPRDDDPDFDASAFETLGYCRAQVCECPADSKVAGRCLMTGWFKTQRPVFYEATKRCVQANLAAIMDLAELVMRKPEERPAYVQSLSEAELEQFFKAHPLNTEACRDRPSSVADTQPASAPSP